MVVEAQVDPEGGFEPPELRKVATAKLDTRPAAIAATRLLLEAPGPRLACFNSVARQSAFKVVCVCCRYGKF